MRPDLEEKLYSDFPLMFREPANALNDSTGFHFECGDGWYQLILELCENLYPLAKATIPDEYGSCCLVSQVKEKYGTLRFYMPSCTSEMSKIINEYEKKSALICEECGNPGRTRIHNGWLSTTCEEHKN